MRRSEIFDNFVKIAQDKGLIAKSSPEENKADLEKTHRADSLSIEDIAHLYGVKPDAPADAKYEHNIMERAHPDPVVIAPSYDKINGLVENNNERQNILLNIVNKTNDGQLLQRKLAKRNLLLSLVRIGNEMDNRGHDELRSLADVCLRQSSAPQIRKEAQLQVIIPVIAAIVGGLYAKQHLRFHSDGFTADYQKAISELDDLLNSNSNFGIGYQYRPEFLQVVNEIKNQLAELNTAVQAILPELDKLETPKDGPDLVRMAKEPKAHEAIQALQNFQTTVHKIYPFLLQVVNNFQNEGYKQRQIVDKGIATKVLDSTEILHGGKGLIADDFDDAAHALETIFYDVNNIAKSLQGADGEADAAAKQLAAANASMPGGGQASESGTAPTEAPAYTSPTLPTAGEMGGSTAKPPVQEVQTRSLEQELEENPDLIGLT